MSGRLYRSGHSLAAYDRDRLDALLAAAAVAAHPEVAASLELHVFHEVPDAPPLYVLPRGPVRIAATGVSNHLRFGHVASATDAPPVPEHRAPERNWHSVSDFAQGA
jgi:hypothetical protein